MHITQKKRSLRLRNFAIREVSLFRDSPRGERFIRRYQKQQSSPRSKKVRTFRITLSFTLFSIGIANAFIPGPGGSVFIFASALVLSSESKHFAIFLDRSEVLFSRQVDWMMKHPIIVSLLISSLIIAVTLYAWFLAAR